MKVRWICILVLFMCSLVSCSWEYSHSYQVTNSSDSTIHVRVVSRYKTDSTFQIAVNETKTVLVTVHNGDKSGPVFVDVGVDLDQMQISQDTFRSQRNYLNNASWTFKEGVYSTSVTQPEFQ